MVLAEHLLEVHAIGALMLAQRLHRGRAGRRRDGLAVELVDRGDAGLGLHGDAHLFDIGRHGKGHILLASRVVRRRAAFEVHRAVDGQRDAIGRGDRLILDRQAAQTQLAADVPDDLLADIDVVADVLAVADRVRQARRLAHTHRDGAGVLDLLQRVLGMHDRETSQQGGSEQNSLHEDSNNLEGNEVERKTKREQTTPGTQSEYGFIRCMHRRHELMPWTRGSPTAPPRPA
mmetsp:Transcript_16913/g.40194  ORF Transcript_16913/g.40194 Transcript_16913/m.40194 type:complete len:232 (-) Transcript_16913:5951-6646(-)